MKNERPDNQRGGSFRGVSIGGKLHFLTEDAFIRELEPMGIRSCNGFRRLCRRLGVPMIHTSEGVYVEVLAFQIAMRAISRVGQGDFVFPGCMTHARVTDRAPNSKEVDPSVYEDTYELILAELAVGRRSTRQAREEMREDTKKAIRRMKDFLVFANVAEAQKEYTDKAIAELRKTVESNGEL